LISLLARRREEIFLDSEYSASGFICIKKLSARSKWGVLPRGTNSASLIRMALISALDHCIEAPNGANEAGGELDSGNDGFGNAFDGDYNNDNATTSLAFPRP
jgi:hypothetical protein